MNTLICNEKQNLFASVRWAEFGANIWTIYGN